jgi:hypothetical protein
MRHGTRQQAPSHFFALTAGAEISVTFEFDQSPNVEIDEAVTVFGHFVYFGHFLPSFS